MEKRNWNTFKIWYFFRQYFSLIIVPIFILILIAMATTLLTPILFKNIIDEIIPSKKISFLNLTSILITTIIFIQLFSSYIYRYLFHIYREKTFINIQTQIFHRILSLNLPDYENFKTGEILNRLSGDLSTIKSLINVELFELVVQIFTFIGAFIILIFYEWRLTLIATFPILPIFYWRKKIEKNVAMYNKAALSFGDDVYSFIEESLSGFYVIKCFNKVSYFTEKITQKLNQLAKFYISTFLEGNKMTTVILLGIGVGEAIIFWLGGIAVINSKLTIGQLIVFTNYLIYFYRPLSRLTGTMVNFRILMNSFDRISILMSLPVERQKGRNFRIISGCIKFENVTFSYGSKFVLKEISFLIPAKSFVALVGRIGAGKTTIINLLLGLLKPHTGRILIDEQDITHVATEELRKQIGVVPQNQFIFSGSILENIQLGDLNITPQSITDYCYSLGVKRILTLLPDLSSSVGNKGVRLSGGQRQLVCLLRALIRKPKIFILDEATSFLDAETEMIVREIINALKHQITIIMIAHRLASVIDADKIIFLQKGRLVAVGDHRELYEKVRKYKILVDRQFIKKEV